MHELPRTINDFKRLGIRTRKEGLYQYLREIKTKVDSIQNEQSELVGFTFYLIDEDKEICAKFVTASLLDNTKFKTKTEYTLGRKMEKYFRQG